MHGTPSPIRSTAALSNPRRRALRTFVVSTTGFLAILCCPSPTVVAQQVPTKTPDHRPASQPESPATPRPRLPKLGPDIKQRIAQAIDELESPNYVTRRRARQRLLNLGRLAEPALKDAVENGPVETKQVAKDALERLNPQPKPQQIAQSANGIPIRAFPGGAPFAPRIQIRVGGGQIKPIQLPVMPINGPGINRLSISRSSSNGKQSAKVQINGKTYQYKQVDGGIEVERPGEKNPIIKTYKTLKELKQDAPEAYKALQRAGFPKDMTPAP